MMYELEPLSADAIPAALERAQRYRLLNEPMEAESICLDVLAAEPGNQEALVTLILALSDQLDSRAGEALAEARELLPRLDGEYRRAYYGGILCERQAKAVLRRASPRARFIAYEELRQALDLFRRAMQLRPPGNDEAVLRWNTCVRTLKRNPKLRPAVEEAVPAMLE